MPNFYYTDSNGQRGLLTPEQLKALAVQGVITPDTELETDTGKKGKAGQIKGLFAAAPAPVSQTVPPNTAQYFYIDANGEKQGAFNAQQLKALAMQGVITPQTPMETATGQKGLAGQIPGLFNTSQSQPIVNQVNMGEMYAFAVDLMINEKQSATETVHALVAQGLNAENASIMVANIEQEIRTAKKSHGGRQMIYGALWFIGGTVLTLASLGSDGGGILFWGAILFGAIQFLYGMFEYFRN